MVTAFGGIVFMDKESKLRKKKCLIINCSKTKIKGENTLPAIKRYDGPLFRVLRKYVLDESQDISELSIYILSAKYGFISANEEIYDYDCFLTSSDANKIRENVLSSFKKACQKNEFKEIFFALSKNYRMLVDGFNYDNCSKARLIFAKGGNGYKSSQLKQWLYDDYKTNEEKLKALKNQSKSIGNATLCGKKIVLSSEQIVEIAEKSLQEKFGNPYNFKDWYVQIGENKVGPKWLVSQLSNVPVGKFTSKEARRVLTQLGVEVISQ